MVTCPGRRATPRAKTAHFVNRTKFVTQHPNIPCNFRLKRFFWETRPFLTSPLLYSSFCHFLLTFEVRRAKVLFETWRKPRDPWRKKDRITTNLKELGIVSSRGMETWDPGALSTVCPFHLKSEKPEGGKMIWGEGLNCILETGTPFTTLRDM